MAKHTACKHNTNGLHGRADAESISVGGNGPSPGGMADTPKPDPELVKQVLWQAFGGGTQRGAIDVYAEAWCLRDVGLPEYEALIAFMLERRLIDEPGQPGFYRITQEGEDWA